MPEGMSMSWIKKITVPPLKSEGWGIFVIDSEGFFSVVSDYGNYAFLWTHPGKPFEQFLMGLSKDYLAGKLSQSGGGPAGRTEFKGEETLRRVKECLLTCRRKEAISRKDARDEWDLLKANNNFCHKDDFEEWLKETSLDWPWDFASYGYPSEIEAFCDRLYPRFVEALSCT